MADHKQQITLTTLTLCTTQLFLILGVMALNEDPGAAKVSLLFYRPGLIVRTSLLLSRLRCYVLAMFPIYLLFFPDIANTKLLKPIQSFIICLIATYTFV